MDNARINAYRGLTRLIKESNVQTSKFNEIPAETCEAVYRRILSYIWRSETEDFSIKSPYIFPVSLGLLKICSMTVFLLEALVMYPSVPSKMSCNDSPQFS